MTKTHNLQTCAICGSVAATSTVTVHEFDYRNHGKLVAISARVPVVECNACGEAYFGDGAEEVKHEAVCNLLERLTPRAIVEIRKSLSMTQTQFAAYTSIGIASIKRWETGLVIQGAAMDRQLRNLEPLVGSATPHRWTASFRTQITDAMKRKAKNFSLRPTSNRQLEAATCTL